MLGLGSLVLRERGSTTLAPPTEQSAPGGPQCPIKDTDWLEKRRAGQAALLGLGLDQPNSRRRVTYSHHRLPSR